MNIWVKWHHWRKVGGNPFYSEGAWDWCRYCQDTTQSQIDQGSYKGVHVYKKNCMRCGQRTHYGIDRRALTSNIGSVIQAVREWITMRGVDRT